jgi:hypothetical protein
LFKANKIKVQEVIAQFVTQTLDLKLITKSDQRPGCGASFYFSSQESAVGSHSSVMTAKKESLSVPLAMEKKADLILLKHHFNNQSIRLYYN